MGKVLLALTVLLLGANRALAYGGPGVDVTFIQTAMTLFLWALAAFSAVLMWPVYALLRMMRGRKNPPAPALPCETPPEAPAHNHVERDGA
jgi:hypothetical protein